MNPLPEQFTNRWAERPGAQPFQDAVCWHVLLGGRRPYGRSWETRSGA